jgi:Ca-activated chloride channel family protein
VGLLRRWPLIPAAALIGCTALLLAQQPDIRVNVRLVRLLITVKDAAGGIVTGLSRGDFNVYDNGVRQNVAVFERQTEQPLSVATLLDTSGSTGIELKYETDSVTRFFGSLVREGNPADSAAFYTFNWQITLQRPYTRNVAALERDTHHLKSEAGTCLYDAIWLASRDLEFREGRHVMVVVTDGGDTTSSRSFQDALEAVQRADAVLYPVVVIPITNSAGRNTGGENALATMAQRTGGRIFLPSLGAALDQAFDDMLRELRTEYLVGYYPQNVPPSSRGYHTLTVKMADPRLRPVTRSGYYEDSER